MFIDSVKKDQKPSIIWRQAISKLSALVNEAYKQTKGLHVIESRHPCFRFNCALFIFLGAKPTFSSRFDNFWVLLDSLILWDQLQDYRQGMHKYGCIKYELKNDKGGTYSKLQHLVSE